MAEKTAVEWMATEIIEALQHGDKDFAYWKLKTVILEQAKEMEAKQRQEDTNYGYSQGWEDGNEGKEPMRPTIKSE